MHLILDQVAVLLSGNVRAGQITPGTEARLAASAAGMMVMVFVVQRAFLIWPRAVWRPLGMLPDHATSALEPAIASGYDLRLRVVNVTPPYLSQDGVLRVHVSVWGRPPDPSRRPSAGRAGVLHQGIPHRKTA